MALNLLPEELRNLMEELAAFGSANDANGTSRSEKMLNITPDTGEFLLLLIRAMQAKHILEIGTSNGYSTLWLSFASQPLNGHVTTFEKSSYKADMAHINFARSGMQPRIDLVQMDAGEFIKQQIDAGFDFIFLDSDRHEYVNWWHDLKRILRLGGLLVADNAVSHAQELENFVQRVHQTAGYLTALAPVGKGEFLVLKDTSGLD